jgi:LemA protein
MWRTSFRLRATVNRTECPSSNRLIRLSDGAHFRAPTTDTMPTGLLTLLMLCAIPSVWGVLAYSRLTALRNAYRSAFMRLDVPLKHRHDRVPGLVELALRMPLPENGDLGSVIAARNSAASARAWAMASRGDAHALSRLDQAERSLTLALEHLLQRAQRHGGGHAQSAAVMAAAFDHAQADLAQVRHAFNIAVGEYNASLTRFPLRLFAQALGFKPAWVLNDAAHQPDQSSESFSPPLGV